VNTPAKLAIALGLFLVAAAALTRRGQQIIAQAEESGGELVGEFGETILQAVGGFSQRAVELVKSFEGYSPVSYPDAGGYSIGYGHFLGSQPAATQITQAEASALLAADMSKAQDLVLGHVGVPLTSGQFDALTSLTYNVGPAVWTNRDGSDTRLKKALAQGDYPSAADAILLFKYSQGRVLPALVARREAERNVFLS